jgi:hypothetical protein
MDENTWEDLVVKQDGTGQSFWVANSHSLFFVGKSYSLAPNSTLPPVVLYDSNTGDNGNGNGDNGNMDWGMHFETDPTSIFEIEGQSSIYLTGFRYHERGNQSSSSIFALGSGVTSVYMPGIYINVPVFFNGGKVFDTPADYVVTGDVYVPSSSNWNQPGQWSGCITLGVSNKACGAATAAGITPATGAGSYIIGSGTADTITGQGTIIVNGTNNTGNSNCLDSVIEGLYDVCNQNYQAVFGSGNTANNYSSFVFGRHGTDGTMGQGFFWSSEDISAVGDNGYGWQDQFINTSTGVASRLSTNGSSFTAATTTSLAASSVFSVGVRTECRDTSNGDWAMWRPRYGVLARVGSANVTYAGDATSATAPDYSGGTGAGASASMTLTPDISLQSLNVSVTPPNTHAWHCHAHVDFSHVN